jgi:uncharacterized protein YjiK
VPRRPRKLVVVGVRRTGMPELSAVAVASDGRIFVADDEHGVGELPSRGRVRYLETGAINGLEGLAVGDGALYAVSENQRRVYRLPLLGNGALGRSEDLGKLPKAGKKKGKGWEGLAWLPAARNVEKRDRLVLVNEDKPRCVGLFDPEDLDDHVLLDLPGDLAGQLDDLSDVAVQPRTGELFLLSHESSAIGVAALVRAGRGIALETRALLPLPVRDAQSEGVVFDRCGRLLLASELGGTLHTLAVR